MSMSVTDWLEEHYAADDELVLMTGYDDCIIGVVERFGCEPFVVYDRTKVLARLQAEGLSSEEALEYHQYNQVGLWAGARTFGFVDLYTPLATQP